MPLRLSDLRGKHDLKLIRSVRDNPALFDRKDPKYSDLNYREVLWQKISDELKCTVAECKERWINIRDINRRALKKRFMDGGKTGLYKYYKELKFLNPCYKDIPLEELNHNDTGDDDIAQDDAMSSVESSCSEDLKPFRKSSKIKMLKVKSLKKDIAKKAKKQSECIVKNQPHNYGEFNPSNQIDSFLLSIGATLKTFSPYHLNLAKSKIFNVVQEHDLQQIVNQENSAYSEQLSEQEQYEVIEDEDDIKDPI